jgi:hypothetical protein
MQIVKKNLDHIVPYVNNARTHSDTQVAQIAASLAEFGWCKPLVIHNGSLVAGHGTLRAAKMLRDAGTSIPRWENNKEAPTVDVSHLSDVQRKAYILADNRIAMSGGWDNDLLSLEMGALYEEDFKLELTGFDPGEIANLFGIDLEGESEGDGALDDTYSRKIEAPIYQPTGETPPVSELFDDAKTRELMASIADADLPPEVAEFLRKAADRHTVFNFAKIAEFYAHADPDIQRLMEASALVIIDFDQAIEGGFVKLTKRLGELTGEVVDAA